MHYVIVGRVPYDDEDTALDFETDSENKAIKAFSRYMMNDLDPEARRMARAECVNDLGVYITHVMWSETPITVRSNP